MEPVKLKVMVDPASGLVFLTNNSDQELEISVEGATNQDPKKPLHLKKDGTIFLNFKAKD